MMVDLEKLTQEQVWRLHCLVIRIAMWQRFPRRFADIYETALDLIIDIELTCKEEE